MPDMTGDAAEVERLRRQLDHAIRALKTARDTFANIAELKPRYRVHTAINGEANAKAALRSLTKENDVEGIVYITVGGAEVEVIDWPDGSDEVLVRDLRSDEKVVLPAESLQPPSMKVAYPGTSSIGAGASVRVGP